MATVTKDVDNEVHITFHDQQQINKFARINARLQDTKEELVLKKRELEKLEEAADELILVDDDTAVPYLIGEVFFMSSTENTNKMLEEAKESISREIEEISEKTSEFRKILSELKVNLYAKFGNNINLEAEDQE